MKNSVIKPRINPQEEGGHINTWDLHRAPLGCPLRIAASNFATSVILSGLATDAAAATERFPVKRYIIHKGLLPKAVYWKVSTTPNAGSAVPVRQRHRSICFECSMTAFSSCSALQARIRVWEHCTRFAVKVASGASVSSWKRV
jgi:hypothetical protein